MMLVNVNKIVYLKDFYNGCYFALDIETLKLKQIENKDSIKPCGYLAVESCGFLKKNRYKFALFYVGKHTYFMFNDKLFDARDIDTLDFSNFIPFVHKLQITTTRGEEIICKRWSIDIDEFLMDDFFYYLNYSYKNNFQNIQGFKGA